MFHNTDNLYFGRTPEGHVRIMKLPGTMAPKEWPRVDGVFPDAVLDMTINEAHWGSIVASVSAHTEENGGWYKAMDFHHNRNQVK